MTAFAEMRVWSLWKGWLVSRSRTLGRIAAEVAEETGVSVERLRSPEKTWEAVEARRVFMWQAAHERGADGGWRYSLPRIGDWLGRDHSTVLLGLRVHGRRMGRPYVGRSAEILAIDEFVEAPPQQETRKQARHGR